MRPLGPPARAGRRRRAFFDPSRGPIRRSERRISNFLHGAVYPRLPGLANVYGGQLLRSLVVRTGRIPVRGLPAAFAGTRIILLTDVHAGPFVSPAVLGRTFRGLAGLRPDLILLGGDIVTRRVAELTANAAAFRELSAPLGVFAVLGNHDHYTREPERLRREIEALGIPVLHNRSVTLERGPGRLSLAGVDDLLMGEPDLAAALRGAEPPVLLLSHHPDVLPEAADRGVALVLSGHTHGGQIRVPGLPVLVRQSRFGLDEGRYREGETELVVSRGLGAVGLPLRIACPPEAALLTLTAPTAPCHAG